MPSKKSEKRKREESEKTTDTVIEINRAASSATLNTNDRQAKKARNGPPPKPTSIQRSQPPRNQHTNNSRACPICEAMPGRQRITGGVMIQCDIDECGLWYHDSCIFKDNTKEPRKMLLFSANQGMNVAAFICPKCLDQPEGYTRDVITQAIRSILGRVTSLLSGEEATPFENSQSPLPDESSPQLISQQLLDRSLENVQWHEGSATILQRPRNEKYHGFDISVIRGLVRTLDECIFNYNKEVCDAIEAFGDPGDEALKVPLKTWQRIDARAAILAGQEWHQIIDGSINPTKGHTPITAALRKMLQIDRDSPLEISASLENLKFSQVHQAFVSWFVIDVLGNRLDIFELPNMKPVRAMMTGVHQFGEERWPEKGRHVLREVQLRTWEKPAFEQEMLKNTQYIIRKMETYLEPLTKEFNKITPWSHHRAQLIETTIRLWSYFEVPGGMFKVIQPAIGSIFNLREQEGYAEDGEKYVPDKPSKKKVLWVIRRGFQYAEKTSDGPRTTSVKAIVLVH
ncbi:hypothetical protein BDZ45DRAFT_679122 [Acephala macrosclerotiorum]|nr:hypothetical protein BDZ45DRAFT_679122 [Acephala macrosclerotiorum]